MVATINGTLSLVVLNAIHYSHVLVSTTAWRCEMPPWSHEFNACWAFINNKAPLVSHGRKRGQEMHGLINRAIQAFVTSTYGGDRWNEVMDQAGLGFRDFEAMLIYTDEQSNKMLSAMEMVIKRPLAEMLEDMGTFLVSNPQVESLRRLLRFGGVNYVEFLHSLDDLPGRARLAVSDLHLPGLELLEQAPGQFELVCQPGLPGYANVMVGILRAMADDYGDLVILDYSGVRDGAEVISITVVERDFAEGRSFDLGAHSL